MQSILELHLFWCNKHVWCDELTKAGAVLQVAGSQSQPVAKVRWWWGCQVPVSVPLEELELIEEFFCNVNAMQT